MIRGLHGMFYTSQADELRAFLRDVLRLPFSDVGGGWLIFDVPEADIGVHPVEDAAHSGTHDISFYCDDIEGTIADLRARGAQFDGELQDQGWGSSISLILPGGVRVGLYEPRYEKSTKKAPAPAPKAKKTTPRTKKAVARPAAAAKAARRKPAAKKKAPAKKSGKKAAKSRRR
jgi:hypothetical protein